MNKILKFLNYILFLAIILLVLNHFSIVLLRYFFALSYNWQNELSLFLCSLAFTAGAGYTYYYNNHVRVDIFYEKFNKKTKEIINIIGIFIFLFPLCFGVIYFSQDYIINSWKIMEKSSNPNGFDFIYIFKSLIILFPLTILFHSLSILKTSFLKTSIFKNS